MIHTDDEKGSRSRDNCRDDEIAKPDESGLL